MSYDISLIDPKTGKSAELPFAMRLVGGTVPVGGTTVADVNITYNYSKHFSRLFGVDGIRTLYGKSGRETLQMLTDAALSLENNVDVNDYWAATDGNVKEAIVQLINLALWCPDGVWDGD